MLERSISIEREELLLCLNSSEGTEKECVTPAYLVAWNVIGDIGNELREEGDLKDLIKCDESQTV